MKIWMTLPKMSMSSKNMLILEIIRRSQKDNYRTRRPQQKQMILDLKLFIQSRSWVTKV